MTDKILQAAEKMIFSFEHGELVMIQDVKQMIESLGGDPDRAEQCTHQGAVVLYIFALMIRNDRKNQQ